MIKSTKSLSHIKSNVISTGFIILFLYTLLSPSSHAVYIDYVDTEAGRFISVNFNKDETDTRDEHLAVMNGTAKLLRNRVDVTSAIVGWVEQAQRLELITFFEISDKNYPGVVNIVESLKEKALLKGNKQIILYDSDYELFVPSFARERTDKKEEPEDKALPAPTVGATGTAVEATKKYLMDD